MRFECASFHLNDRGRDLLDRCAPLELAHRFVKEGTLRTRRHCAILLMRLLHQRLLGPKVHATGRYEEWVSSTRSIKNRYGEYDFLNMHWRGHEDRCC